MFEIKKYYEMGHSSIKGVKNVGKTWNNYKNIDIKRREMKKYVEIYTKHKQVNSKC